MSMKYFSLRKEDNIYQTYILNPNDVKLFSLVEELRDYHFVMFCNLNHFNLALDVNGILYIISRPECVRYSSKMSISMVDFCCCFKNFCVEYVINEINPMIGHKPYLDDLDQNVYIHIIAIDYQDQVWDLSVNYTQTGINIIKYVKLAIVDNIVDIVKGYNNELLLVGSDLYGQGSNYFCYNIKRKEINNVKLCDEIINVKVYDLVVNFDYLHFRVTRAKQVLVENKVFNTISKIYLNSRFFMMIYNGQLVMLDNDCGYQKFDSVDLTEFKGNQLDNNIYNIIDNIGRSSILISTTSGKLYLIDMDKKNIKEIHHSGSNLYCISGPAPKIKSALTYV